MEELEAIEIILASCGISLSVIFSVMYWYIWHLHIKPLIAMGKRFASSMGSASGEAKHYKQTIQLQNSAKEKIVHNGMKALPFGEQLEPFIAKMGLTNDEVFALLQNQDFVKGIMTIIQMGGNVVGFISQSLGGAPKKDAENTMPYGAKS